MAAQKKSGGGWKLAVAGGVLLAVASNGGHHHGHGLLATLTSSNSGHHHHHGHKTGNSGQAIAYARAQLGKPYCWGGTGSSCFDCSGLVMKAEQSAGTNIPRTSQEQWASLPHVSHPRPGDLVFFAGSDGTSSSPGHVGLVVGKHAMLEAYATGYPIRVSRFGTPNSPPGDGSVVGFARP